MHTQIFELSYFGKGYNPEIVYRMPIWLRNFHWNKVKEQLDRENSEIKKAGKKSDTPQIFGPGGKIIK